MAQRALLLLSLLFSVNLMRAIRLIKGPRPSVLRRYLSTPESEIPFSTTTTTSDLLLTGLNGAQTISVKVVNCREVVQEAMLRNDLSVTAATTLAEVMACALMMGSGYKNQETLQVNIVGTGGMRNCMAITDGELKIRGMVGDPRFSLGTGATTRDLFGEGGQIQIVRNHPTWKRPQTGIVALRDASVPLNLALYMIESEQRSAALLVDVKIDNNLCRHALAVCVERLPGAQEEDLELSIRNLEEVERRGLASFLVRTEEERRADTSEFRDFEPVLGKILDRCLENMGEELRWSKTPTFRCSCDVEKVWRTLRLLPRSDIEEILQDPQNVEAVQVACEFCQQKYAIPSGEIREKILSVLQ